MDKGEAQANSLVTHRTYKSLVRDNLLTRQHYTPYCAADKCPHRWPRTRFDGKQFVCRCGWQSNFEPQFIQWYKEAQADMGQVSDGASTPTRKKVAVLDEGTGKILERFYTIAEAEDYIAKLPDKEKVESGGYGIDAPEEMVNPPK